MTPPLLTVTSAELDVPVLVALFPEPLLFVDIEGQRVREANEAAADLTGYGLVELAQAELSLLVPGQAVHGVQVKRWQDLLAAPGLHEEVPLRRRDGSCFVASLTVSLLPEPTKGALLFLRDPTARRLLERELIEKHMALREAYEELARVNTHLEAQNQKLEEQRTVVSRLEQMATLGRFAAGVAHEINNPLAFVLENLRLLQEHAGYLQPLLEREVGARPTPRIERVADELQDLLVESLQGAERVRDIVRQIHAFSNTQDRRREVISLEEIVEPAITMVQNQIRQVARLERDYVEVFPVRCVAGQLTQVVVNLLVNAIHAVDEAKRGRGRIAVRLRPVEGTVCLEIEDSGVGMDSALIDKAFEPFFTTKRAGRGTGLGLSISSSIVQQHGGTLELFSEPGQGAIARVMLPAAQATAGETAAPAAQKASVVPRRLKVLFVDDEELLLRAMARRFRSEHDIVTAADPAAARNACAEQGPFDLVLIDMMMPEASGPELLLELEQEHPWLQGRVAFMSGGVFGERGDARFDLRGVRVFEKPIEIDLRQLLAGAREERGDVLGAVDES
jgi:PAS domain S-box-containing protein